MIKNPSVRTTPRRTIRQADITPGHSRGSKVAPFTERAALVVNTAGDAVGIEQRGQLQRGPGQPGRAQPVRVLDRQRPGDRDRVRVVVGQRVRQEVGDAPGPVGEAGPVLRAAQVVVQDERRSLRQRQRQLPQLGGQRVGLRQPGRVAAQFSRSGRPPTPPG